MEPPYLVGVGCFTLVSLVVSGGLRFFNLSEVPGEEVLSLGLQIFHYGTVKQEKVSDGAKNVKIRWLITEKNGATNFMMRHFEMGPDGFTPLHKHPYEHEIFVLSGSGVVTVGSEEKTFSEGDVIFIPPNVEHQLRSRVKTEFLCFIPMLRTA